MRVQVPFSALFLYPNAEMAELADAHGSGPCDSNIMRVQVPFSARIQDCRAGDSVSGAAVFHIKQVLRYTLQSSIFSIFYFLSVIFPDFFHLFSMFYDSYLYFSLLGSPF